MRHRLSWQWSLMLTATLCVAQARGAGTAPEYEVKAAFLYKFATYIRWPAPPGADATTPFVIGILGRDPFGSALLGVVRDQNVHGRSILIRKFGRMEEALHCDLLFVSSSERGNLRQIVAALHGAPVLTVGDMDHFAEQGGMIGLVTTEDRHVRFDINKGAIDRAGLKAPSQLLQLARIVESRGDGW